MGENLKVHALTSRLSKSETLHIVLKNLVSKKGEES